MKHRKGLSQVERYQLKEVLDDITWMAIRYAHGRHTMAPSTVRMAVKTIKDIYPDFKLKKDPVLEAPEESELGGMSFRDDYLNDLFED